VFSHENSVGFDRLIGSEIAIPDGIEKTWTKMLVGEQNAFCVLGVWNRQKLLVWTKTVTKVV
jgi:hypothetical protein